MSDGQAVPGQRKARRPLFPPFHLPPVLLLHGLAQSGGFLGVFWGFLGVFGGFFEGFWGVFWRVFGGFWGVFWRVFGGFWGVFWRVFGGFLEGFGGFLEGVKAFLVVFWWFYGFKRC